MAGRSPKVILFMKYAGIFKGGVWNTYHDFGGPHRLRLSTAH